MTQIMVLIKMSKFSLRIIRFFWLKNYHICDTSCDVFFHMNILVWFFNGGFIIFFDTDLGDDNFVLFSWHRVYQMCDACPGLDDILHCSI